MVDLFDDDIDREELVEGALSLNHTINAETDVVWSRLELNHLLSEAELTLVNEQGEEARFDAFVRLFYQQWQFQGDSDSYFSSDNAFIDKVLTRKKGTPLSLGAIFLYLARKLGFPVEGVAFPTQFLLKVTWPEQTPCYLNPFNGEYVDQSTLRAWLIGHDGPLAKLKPEHLKTADNATVIGRWLAVIKSALLREERYSLALKCTDLALTFVPDDPYEIRDRGFIYQQLDCFQIAKSDFEFFIDQCPEDPAADLLKSQIQALGDSPVTLH